MISSFKHKGLREFFETNSKRGVPPELSTRLRDRLDVIDAATTLEDIGLPHFGLHELRGDRAGSWAVKVNKNLANYVSFCERRCERCKLRGLSLREFLCRKQRFNARYGRLIPGRS